MAEEDTDQGIPPPEGEVELIETDYTLGQDNVEHHIGPVPLEVHRPVFAISALSVIVFVLYALIFREQAAAAFGAMQPWLTSNFDWFLMIAANIFVLFCLALIVSPWGSIRLGGAEATPDYSYIGWFAMLFAAGMGIGLMFFGVVEPVYHMAVSEPLGTPSPFDAAGNPVPADIDLARRMGLAATIYHWALHPWAIYAVVALALALFTYNKGLPLTIRSAFYPIFGERVWGWPGHVIDVLAVFATLFGLATSLGLGAKQAGAGLHFIWNGIPNSVTMQVILIIGITAIALISVLRGLDAGVRLLSEINMGMAALLLLFVLALGPTLETLTGIVEGLWTYARELVPLSNPIGRTDDIYRQDWTAFYWAWWISWSPFVGMFIARVSRGRTVREFLISVLIIPSLVCVLWMSVFGGTAIHQALAVPDSLVRAYVIEDYQPELSLFGMLAELPFAGVTSFLGIILVIVFFVTSSDSGSLVIDTITAGGKVNAPVAQRVFWCIFEGVVAIVLLLGGGLVALQAMAVSTGLPFTLVLLLMCFAIVRGLQAEPR